MTTDAGDTDTGLWLEGIIPAMLTPMKADGAIDPDGAAQLAEHLIGEGADGLYLLGSTGEGIHLSEAERRDVAAAVTGAVAGRIPVVVHVGACATSQACRLAEHAASVGADGVSSVQPVYYATNADQLIAHYRSIATATDLPFYSYLFTSAAIQGMDPRRFIESMCEVAQFRGFKYTAPETYVVADVRYCEPRRLNILYGQDEGFLAGRAMGADGAIGTYYNLFTPFWKRMDQAIRSGDLPLAQRLMQRATTMVNTVKVHGLGVVKGTMALRGLPAGPVREPLTNVPLDRCKELLAYAEQTLADA